MTRIMVTMIGRDALLRMNKVGDDFFWAYNPEEFGHCVEGETVIFENSSKEPLVVATVKEVIPRDVAEKRGLHADCSRLNSVTLVWSRT